MRLRCVFCAWGYLYGFLSQCVSVHEAHWRWQIQKGAQNKFWGERLGPQVNIQSTRAQVCKSSGLMSLLARCFPAMERLEWKNTLDTLCCNFNRHYSWKKKNMGVHFYQLKKQMMMMKLRLQVIVVMFIRKESTFISHDFNFLSFYFTIMTICQIISTFLSSILNFTLSHKVCLLILTFLLIITYFKFKIMTFMVYSFIFYLSLSQRWFFSYIFGTNGVP